MRVKLPFLGEFRLFEPAIDLGAAARAGTLSSVPVELLTEKALTTIDQGKGCAPIHIAAMFGHLDQIPEERLTPTVMSAPSLDKLNAFHYAAREDHLDQVPKQFLRPDILIYKGQAEWSPADEIASRKELGFVPEAFFTTKVLTNNSDRMSVIEKCVRGGLAGSLPASALTPEVMTARTCGARATAMHVVAEIGCWNDVPASLQNAETLLLQDTWGRTPLHYAAEFGKVREVPAKLLTESVVLKQNVAGETPLHEAASLGNISWFPPEFLTRENLSQVDSVGRTAYHYLAKSGTLRDLPAGALERSDLLRPNAEGNTPLHDAAAAATIHLVPEIIEVEDLHMRNKKGQTCEGVAESAGHIFQAQIVRNVEAYLALKGKAEARRFSLPAEPQFGPPTPIEKVSGREP